jgi:septal ring factor EnvC (AmiA/AmiB activator)
MALAEAIARRTRHGADPDRGVLLAAWTACAGMNSSGWATLIEQVAERENENWPSSTAGLRKTREKLDKTGSADPHALEALQSELADQRDRLAEAERGIESLREAIERHEQASRRDCGKAPGQRAGPDQR